VDDIGHAYQGVPVEAATAGALYAYGLAAHNSAVRRVSAEIVEAYLIAGGGTQVLKYAIGRARPFNNQGPSHFVGPTVHNRNHSFPSGDCGSAFAFSTVLTAESRSLPVGVILYSLAATTAFQRLNRDQHWLSDVIGGAVWGTAVGLAVVNMNRKLVVSGKSVTVQPSRQGIGVQLSF
jgi:membrane-associated phospholipid phosphatase